MRNIGTGMLCASLVLAAHIAMPALAGEPGASWQVAKASGDVWVSTGGTQQAALTNATPVSPGQTVRTGANGMALLTRGAESMLVSPNSVIEIPTENRDGMSTTIFEKAGSVLLDVEKRNVQHFEVVTPYLAAVVKGTHFSVSVDGAGSQVQVLRGQVDVSDFHTGEQVLLLPSQQASVAGSGDRALNVSGSGLFNPVRVGKPRSQPFAPAQPNIKSAALDRPAAPEAAGAGARIAAASAPAAPSQQRALPPLVSQADRADFRKNWRESADKFDPLSMVAVPASLGLLVSFAVAIGRGIKRRSRKDDQGRR